MGPRPRIVFRDLTRPHQAPAGMEISVALPSVAATDARQTSLGQGPYLASTSVITTPLLRTSLATIPCTLPVTCPAYRRLSSPSIFPTLVTRPYVGTEKAK